MRNLYDIVEDVKDGKKPEYEELRYALLVYVAMFNMDHRNLREELFREKETPEFIRKMKATNSFDMFKKALNSDPKVYIGKDDPDNPEYQKFRKIGNKLLEKIIKKSEEKE